MTERVQPSVTHFEIFAEDPASLAEFYRTLFGWKIDKAPGVDYFRIHTGELKTTNVQGGILHRAIQGPRSWVHYVLVESIDLTLERLESLGGKVVHPKTAVPKTAWYAVAEDPQGNMFAVYERDARAFPAPEPEI